MQNPWLNLPSKSDYILEIDRKDVLRYNGSRHKEDRKIILKTIPEPFIGNPRLAKVVLLNLNPGYSKEDLATHRDDEFKEAIFHNLHHERQRFPFYPLNPKFEWTGAGKWWLPRTCELLKAGLDLETIAEGLLVIEWFPYHSTRAELPIEPFCCSQEYSFSLAKKMLEDGRLVVGMRSKRRWARVCEKLGRVPYLKNPRCGHISRKNAGEELLAKIVRALKSKD